MGTLSEASPIFENAFPRKLYSIQAASSLWALDYERECPGCPNGQRLGFDGVDVDVLQR